ncbi:putative reverse transcriptase domain-containing protein [Tanacetum coccineum]
MPPRMRTRSVDQPVAKSREGGTGERVGRGGRGRGRKGGNDERVDELNGQGNDQEAGANENVERVNRGVGGAPDFSMIIAQQLQNLLPAILAQVGNQGNVGSQNGNAVSENVQKNVRNVLVNRNRVGCSYKEFLACNPKEYDGKGGAVVLTRWIEKMESVQDMSGCSIDQKVKYTTSSFVEEFCPSYEMQKLETKLWNHVMVGASHAAYIDRFHELARLVHHLVTPKSRKIKRYAYGLALQIRWMVAATEPKTMQKAVEISGALTNEAVRNGSIKKVKKRGNVGEPSKHRNGRDDNKRTRTGNAFATTANPVGRENTGAWPKCTTCNSYQAPGGPCHTCFNYNRPGHFVRDCRVMPRNVNPVNVRNPAPARRACYKYGCNDHLKPACPRLNKAQGLGGNRPNQVVANNGGQGRGNQGNQARGRAFMLGAKEARHDSNIMTGMFTLNDHYATTLFDSGADYSFVSTSFIPLIGIEPSDLGFSYEIEIASGQVVEIDKVIKGCKLEIEGHVFDINLIPIRSGSFDVIIGMDWLSDHKLEIICHEKVVRVPLLDGKVLRVLEEKPEEKMRLLTQEELEEHLGLVLELIKEEKLYAKFILVARSLGLGCVLMQRGKVIAYASRQLEIHKKNYTTHDLELGAVRRWIELFSDYDCEIRYHPGKTNVVADALSRKEREEASDKSKGLQRGLDEMIELRNDEVLYYLDQIWVPLKGDVRTLIINEAHKSKYFVHPGADKMYYDLRDRPSSLLWQAEIPKWKCEGIAMDFVTKLPRTSSGYDTIWVIVDRLTKSAHFLPMREDYKMDRLAKLYLNEIVARHGVPIFIISDRDSQFTSRFWQSMQGALGTRGSWDVHLPLVEFSYDNSYHSCVRCALFEALYGIKCRSPIMWAEVGEVQLIGHELVQEITEKISKKGKLAPRFVGPFEIIEKVSPVTYMLDLLEKLNGVHDTFHVSNLKKCLADLTLQFKKLKRSRIAIVKGLWNSKHGPEFTWEREDQIKLKYPHLFSADK